MTFTIGRIKIKLHFLFFIMLAYMFSENAGKMYLTALFYAALHECGHIFTILHRHGGNIDVTVGLAGMSIDRTSSAGLSAVDDAIVAFSGPCVNIILSALFYFLQRIFGGDDFISASLTINVCLAAFNLLPIIPLDGGRFLYGILSRVAEPGIAGIICTVSGAVSCAACIAVCAASGFSVSVCIACAYASVLYVCYAVRRKF